MNEENKNPSPPSAAASAPAQAASAASQVAGDDNCTPATDVLKSRKVDNTKDNYIISAYGKNGERVTAFVEGTFTQKDGKTVLSDDARVTLMGSKGGKSYPHSRTSEGNIVQDILTREEMLDPSVSGTSRNPQFAAKMRAAAAEMLACSNVGPAVEILSSDPRAPMGTPTGPAGIQREK